MNGMIQRKIVLALSIKFLIHIKVSLYQLYKDNINLMNYLTKSNLEEVSILTVDSELNHNHLLFIPIHKIKI